MSKKSLYLLAVAVVFVAGTMLAWRFFRPDPVYRGKRLSSWIREVSHVAKLNTNFVPREVTLSASDVLQPLIASASETNETLFSSEQTALRFSYETRDLYPRVPSGKIRPPPPLVAKRPTIEQSQVLNTDQHTDSERDCLNAIRALGPDAMRVVLRMLEKDDLELNRRAAWALGEIGPISPHVMPALVRMYQSRDTPVKRGWFWLWERLPPALRKLFSPPTSHVAERRNCAARAIIKIATHHRFAGPSDSGRPNPAQAGIDAFIADLNNPDWRVKRETVVYLADLGLDARGAIPELVRRLADKGQMPMLREEYARTLGKIGVASTEVISVLVEAADDRWDLTSDAAIKSLGALGSTAKTAVPYLLTNALQNPDAGTRRRAYDALYRIDPEAIRNLHRESGPQIEGRGRYRGQ